MSKQYLDIDVYQAAQKRLKYLFNEFDHLHVAFSGGKDSGVMLNLVIEYAKKHDLLDHVSVHFADCEVQYQHIIDYVKRTFDKLSIEKYWVCLPIKVKSAVSMKNNSWIPWKKSQKAIWVREMPKYDFVVNEDNVEFNFWEGMQDHFFENRFNEWIANKHKGKTAVLVGIRADESLNRYRAIKSENKINGYKDKNYIIKKSKYCAAYPIYDWSIRDDWIANGKFNFDYDKLYDLYYLAGMPIEKMRVASPFTSEALDSLKYYQVIEPKMWAKMVNRVNGIDFAGIYGDTAIFDKTKIKLPKGRTWQNYTEFLLKTCPLKVKTIHQKTLENSKKDWQEHGLNFRNSTVKNEFYKEMAITIIKNEYSAKYMEFNSVKAKLRRKKKSYEKYAKLF